MYQVKHGPGLWTCYMVSAMEPHEKLLKLLTPLKKGGGGVRPGWLGKKIEEHGLSSGYNLVYKWSRGDRGFEDRNQRLVEEIVGKPRGWFNEDSALPTNERPALDRNAQDALLVEFLGSELAEKMTPPVSPEEIRMLRAHNVDGRVSVEYYYHFLQAERARLSAPTMRPNMAAPPTRPVPPQPRGKAGKRKPPGASR